MLGGIPHRPTADIDLLGFGSNKPEDLKKVFTDICNIKVNDGLEFTEISTDVLQKGTTYQGVRLLVKGSLEDVPFKTQVDIGFGHKIVPGVIDAEFPTLLDRPKPKIRRYPIETIVAEKLEAITSIGIRNSRLKDYYDLLYLSRNFEFDGKTLTQAIGTTFNHRQTPIPTSTPVGLTQEYVTHRKFRSKEWKNLYQQGTMKARSTLEQTLYTISSFVLPPLLAAKKNQPLARTWKPQSQTWERVNIFDRYETPPKNYTKPDRSQADYEQ